MRRVLYEGMLGPIAPLSITGFCGTRASTNSTTGKVLPAMIADWRRPRPRAIFVTSSACPPSSIPVPPRSMTHGRKPANRRRSRPPRSPTRALPSPLIVATRTTFIPRTSFRSVNACALRTGKSLRPACGLFRSHLRRPAASGAIRLHFGADRKSEVEEFRSPGRRVWADARRGHDRRLIPFGAQSPGSGAAPVGSAA